MINLNFTFGNFISHKIIPHIEMMSLLGTRPISILSQQHHTFVVLMYNGFPSQIALGDQEEAGPQNLE